LEERNTYTPTNTPHVRSSSVSSVCDQSLKDLRGRVGVPDLKTSSNNPEVDLTAKGQAGQGLRVPVIYVLNQRGKPLMPCSPRKARLLLKEEKADVVNRTPFTIQLTTATGESKQDIKLGVDSGFIHIGLSATTEKKEVLAAEVILRKDIVDLNSERRSYRKTRRNRKTWYRKPRFLNRKKSKIEVAAFDIQKIKNPDIAGTDYQQGEQLGFWNIREYVLHRDSHKCQHCKGKTKDKVLNIHHLMSRKTGGDRPSNLVTLCETCHNYHHQGKIKLKIKKTNGFKAETFMSTVRWKLVNILKQVFPNINHTYGYLTKNTRIKNKIAKSHINDAFVIADGITQKRTKPLRIKQIRKNNRKLYKGSRSHLKNTAPLYIKGFKRYDKVLFEGKEAFIFGRRSTGYFDIRTLAGEKIHASAKAKELKLLESSSAFLKTLEGVVK